MSDLVSIIVNCYNGEKYLKHTLESIQKQKYSDWELIFWDNQSTDNSKKIFDTFKDTRFKYYYSNRHTTLYEARNLACQKSKGKFISFLDCDDFWYEDFLSDRKIFLKMININFLIQIVTFTLKKAINMNYILNHIYQMEKYMMICQKIM